MSKYRARKRPRALAGYAARKLEPHSFYRNDPDSQLPPTDLDAERALLGGLLLESSRVASVRGLLGIESFCDTAHRNVWELLLLMVDAGTPIDLVTVRNAADQNGVLEVIGGAEYLTELVESVPSAAHVDHYARIVCNHHIRRQAIHAAGDVFETAHAAGPNGDDDLRASLHRMAALAEMTAGMARQTEAPSLLSLADVRPEAVRWLWPNRLALGKLAMISGDPGLSKSFLTLDIAARVSTGRPWPDASLAFHETGGVVLLSAEDGVADTIRPRFDAAGGDPARVTILTAVRLHGRNGLPREKSFNLADDLVHLETAIAATTDCKLVIVDPISAYMGSVDSHVNADVRGLLAPLSALAERRGVAVLVVQHLRKGEGSALHRSIGSIAFVAHARTAWVVTADPDDAEGNRRLLLPSKTNIAPKADGLAYRLVPAPNGSARLAWEDTPVEISADAALAAPKGKPGPDCKERDAVVAWLKKTLADGPRLANDVYDEGQHGEGFSRRTIERARKEAGVKPDRPVIPGPWYWQFPVSNSATLPPTPSTHEELGDLGGLAKSLGNNGDSDAHLAKTAKLFERGGLEDSGIQQGVEVLLPHSCQPACKCGSVGSPPFPQVVPSNQNPKQGGHCEYPA